MRRRLLCVLITVWLMTGLGVAAGAVSTGSITVDWGREGGSVTLFQVGEPISGGYMLRKEFGGGVIPEKDAASQVLAQWLWDHVEYEGWALPGEDGGVAEFQQLEEGLYLIVQNRAPEGYYPFSPFLVELPCQGQWHVQAVPKMQQYPTELPPTGQGQELEICCFGMLFSALGLIFLTRKGIWHRVW